MKFMSWGCKRPPVGWDRRGQGERNPPGVAQKSTAKFVFVK
jgi:hypothetical protein